MSVIVVGSLNVDRVTRVKRLPAPGETVLGGDTVLRPGGKGANQAVAAAEWGAHVKLIGRVGADQVGRLYLEGLAARNVDVDGIVVDSLAPTGSAHILVDDRAENLIVVEPGANARLTPDDIRRNTIGPDDVLLLQLEIPVDTAECAVEAAQLAGATVVLNLSPFAHLEQKTIDRCSVIIVNATEAEQLANYAVDDDQLVITMGANGARWGDMSLPAALTKVVDTTGAGDAFAGVLAAAIAAGRPRREALSAAITFAGHAVARVGAQDWTFPV
jgi:ribokinase